MIKEIAKEAERHTLNGYRITADGYKQYLEQNPTAPAAVIEDMTAKIKIYTFLAGLNRRETLEIFNSGAYNSVVHGYLQMAIDNTEIDTETGSKILHELYHLFDTITAEQAEAYITAN